MFKTLLARARQGYRTAPYPVQDANLPALFRGRPVISPDQCVPNCTQCVDACPTDALRVTGSGPQLDIGQCIFCGECAKACPSQAIVFSRDWRLAASTRESLVISGDRPLLINALGHSLKRLLGRSLRLRQVSAGGCNGCEVEANALGNVVFDSGRFGIEFVASPRHADGILITGPVTLNMREALLKTYEAVAEPKLVIASGSCAISGGIFKDHPEASNGTEDLLSVDLYVSGCPPHPFTILDGILRLLGRE